MKGDKFLKVTGILMIIGAAFALLFGVFASGVTIACAAMGAAALFSPLYYLSLIVMLASGVCELIAGIFGVKYCKNPGMAKKCITWGIVVAALSVLGIVLSVIGGGEISFLTILTGLVVPVLYIVGAVQNQKSTSEPAQDQ